MKHPEQSVHKNSRVINKVTQLLPLQTLFQVLFLTFALVLYFPLTASAKTVTNNKQIFNVTIIYSTENPFSFKVSEAISNLLEKDNNNIKASTKSTADSFKKNTDLFIGIGVSATQLLKDNDLKANSFFIATNPETFKLKQNNNKNAVLYMTQSYCKQLFFIKQINQSWKDISIITSKKKLSKNTEIQQCAKKYGFNIHFILSTDKKNLSLDIKSALSHSDVLFALPDKNIYNSETVKHILLTSYRYRKPVFAFSKAFVNAGAIASIHSNTNQIATSAKDIITDYFNKKQKFKGSINYPQNFETSLNQQVFRTLELTTPNPLTLKQAFKHLDNTVSGAPK